MSYFVEVNLMPLIRSYAKGMAGGLLLELSKESADFREGGTTERNLYERANKATKERQNAPYYLDILVLIDNYLKNMVLTVLEKNKKKPIIVEQNTKQWLKTIQLELIVTALMSLADLQVL